MFTLLAFVCNDEDIQEVLRRVASTSCFKYFNVMTRCFELRTHSVYLEPLQQGVLLAFFSLSSEEILKSKNRNRILFFPGLLWKVASFLRPFSGHKIGAKKAKPHYVASPFWPPFFVQKVASFLGPPLFRIPPSRSQGLIESLTGPNRMVRQ